ncbi:hypothetical protein Tco_0194456 [Tanacetum coccineum]
MADNRTMAQLLQAPTEGYEDAIVIPEINANFELKHDSLNSAAWGKTLDKMPRECLRIIESKSKVRNSRNKAVRRQSEIRIHHSRNFNQMLLLMTTEVSELKN